MTKGEAAPAPLALEAAGLRCGYNDRLVLAGVDCAVAEGAFLGIVGPNGCGKSTLLRALSGVLKPYAGTVRLFGQPVHTLPPRAVARLLAVVPQALEAPFGFTVEELVWMGRYPHLGRLQPAAERDRAAVEQALAETGLLAIRSRLVTEVSGGEYQMAVIARALAQQPKVLLLDEPTAHLDLGHQKAVLELLTALNAKSGMTVVFVSHDLNVAAEYCHNLVMMHRGRIVASGPPHAVLQETRLAEIYGTQVLVRPHPLSGNPHLFLLRGEAGPQPRTADD